MGSILTNCISGKHFDSAAVDKKALILNTAHRICKLIDVLRIVMTCSMYFFTYRLDFHIFILNYITVDVRWSIR